jgi:ABC-type antimicrobial peptide transport system permease subunit
MVLLVFGAVGSLLLIAVANIAGLTLAQLHQREREMVIRSSVGASRGQVVATVMREVLVVAAAGAALGGAAAAVAVRLIAKTLPDLPRLAELRFDWRALLFAVSASLAAAVVFGLVPAGCALACRSHRPANGDPRGIEFSLCVLCAFA